LGRAGAVIGASLLALLPARAGAPIAPAAPARGTDARIELVEQTPVVPSPGTYEARVRLPGVPLDGSVRLSVHQRVRSRSELALSMEGEDLGSLVFQTVTPLSDAPPQADGTRRITLSLDPTAGGLSLPQEGVYPVELVAQDATGTPVAELVTHLITPPEEGDDAPSLAVAPVADVGTRPALRPDGTLDLRPGVVDDLAAMVSGLADAPGVPVSIAARPETVEALASSADDGHNALVDDLRAAVGARTVLALPYAAVDIDDLAPAGLLGELAPHLVRGSSVLTEALGVQPDARVQLSPPGLDVDGLETLAFLGVERVVVDDDQVEPLEEGIVDYSLAQPFVLAVPEGTDTDDPTPGTIQALATDPLVQERLATAGPPGLVASRVLAELALLRLEQPSVARAVVLPLDLGASAEEVRLILDGLDAGRPFSPVGLSEAFDHAAPLLDGGGNPVERALLPVDSRAISDSTGRAVNETRALLDSFTTLVGAASALPDEPERHVLLATASGLEASERRAHLAAASAAVDAVTSQVSMPATFTLTLTARDGTIPLTITNSSGVPLKVSIHLSSQRLDFPDGEVVPVTLTEETTRLELRVRSRGTGAFPLVIDLRSADGELRLATSRYTVRSTAISGAGLILSVGAGVFLTVWWARHWRRTRRSRRLVQSPHPAKHKRASVDQ
jgi:hypothetical protein